MRVKAVADGKQVNIPVLVVKRDGGTQEDRQAGCWISRCKRVGLSGRQIRRMYLRRESVAARPEAAESMLPRKAPKFIHSNPYRKPTPVGGMNNPRRSRELWPRNSAK